MQKDDWRAFAVACTPPAHEHASPWNLYERVKNPGTHSQCASAPGGGQASLEGHPYYRLIVSFREPQGQTRARYAFRRALTSTVYVVM